MHGASFHIEHNKCFDFEKKRVNIVVNLVRGCGCGFIMLACVSLVKV